MPLLACEQALWWGTGRKENRLSADYPATGCAINSRLVHSRVSRAMHVWDLRQDHASAERKIILNLIYDADSRSIDVWSVPRQRSFVLLHVAGRKRISKCSTLSLTNEIIFKSLEELNKSQRISQIFETCPHACIARDACLVLRCVTISMVIVLHNIKEITLQKIKWRRLVHGRLCRVPRQRSYVPSRGRRKKKSECSTLSLPNEIIFAVLLEV